VERPARRLRAALRYGLTAMSPATTQIPPFIIKDCALIQIATGVRAQNVRDLRDRLELE
jgi:uncharacterized protein DUF5752